MMKSMSKTMNFSAVSVVADGELTMNVAYMTASVGANGLPNFNQNIQNYELYKEHKTECDSDFEDFKTEVMKYV